MTRNFSISCAWRTALTALSRGRRTHRPLLRGCLPDRRVLNADGQVAEGFHWGDPSDTRDPIEVLRAEGVSLDTDGRADPAGRLDARALAKRSGVSAAAEALT